MSTAKDKWKRGFSKLTRKDSSLSQTSIMEEETNEDEVEAYLSKLKKKTGLRNLWSGNKFGGFVDGDRTPDISSDSDDELDMKLSMNVENFRSLTLDSDEDEMRINYMRQMSGKRKDENNNKIDDSENSSDGPINLMQNIHFAELKIAEVELSDTEIKVDKPDDFLPQIYAMNFDNENENDSDSSELNFRKNIHVLSDITSEVTSESRGENDINLRKHDSIKTVESGDSILTEEEISEISHHSDDPKSSASSYTQSNFESEVSSGVNRTQIKPLKICASSCHSSRSLKKASGNKQSSYSTETPYTSESNSDVTTLYSTSSISIDDSSRHSKKVKKHRQHKKDRSHSKSPKKTPTKSVCTQTKDDETQKDDLTNEVLNFRYYWKQKNPSNIAAHTVDVAAMEAMTNYNPAVLAANDMLKFHLDLLRRHIGDSQRLYESYASEGLNRNYKYTSYEDTLKYIKQKKPKVISYEEALKQIQKES